MKTLSNSLLAPDPSTDEDLTESTVKLLKPGDSFYLEPDGPEIIRGAYDRRCRKYECPYKGHEKRYDRTEYLDGSRKVYIKFKEG